MLSWSGNPRWPITCPNLFASAARDARVETFVADGGTPLIAAIIVGGKHQRLIRKREKFLRNRVELFAGVAAGKITRWFRE